jgi:DNA (cytosine-5)-methyltransferase 1
VNFISLFTCIGGFDLGLEAAGMKCIGQVEIDPFCQQVLKKRWPKVPKVGDIRDCNATSFKHPDLICGGFPCQPFSTAGKRAGENDDRYLWPEMLRVIEAYRPPWVLGENVSGITTMELGKVLASLEGIGYETQCFNIPACAVEAPHERQRIWIMAYSKSLGRGWRRDCRSRKLEESSRLGERKIWPWSDEPMPIGVAYGVPNRVDRLRTLGSAIIPKIAFIIGSYIMEIENAQP